MSDRSATPLRWVAALCLCAVAAAAFADDLAPRGKIHIPIGVANTNDRLKTFVEPEGCFSPGVGSYGVYFWATDPATGKLVAPTQPGVKVDYGLPASGALVPWSQWSAGPVTVRSEVCHTLQKSPKGDVHVVAARVTLTNTSVDADAKLNFFVAVRPLGPAGFAIRQAGNSGEALFVNFAPAVVAHVPPIATSVSATDDPAALTAGNEDAAHRSATSPTGDASASMRYAIALKPNQSVTLPFVCPVLPGRRVVPHQWDGVSSWAQFDLAPYNPPGGGLDAPDRQPKPDIAFYRDLKVDDCFAQAHAYYKDLAGRATVTLPDPRWTTALCAITNHAALAMNDDAPDVTVLNYNVFNRDGIYVTNILQKAGRGDLAARCIDYFLAHPFNGRVQPEADNPGQILWIVGEHFRFTRDKEWLAKVYPGVQKLAAMIRYYRTTPEPHWVWDTSLDFGDALPPNQRKRLKPGACDGHHPEYTEAWDVAGLLAASGCAVEVGNKADAVDFATLGAQLFRQYDAKFGQGLAKDYGSYSVLWPCRLYPFATAGGRVSASGTSTDNLDLAKAVTQFKNVGAQKGSSWRYFPLAKSHQGLLAGNRAAGHATIDNHLAHEQMKGFYAFDEGGKSGSAGWRDKSRKELLRTTWNGDVAMPHGWAIAELHLLIRDSLVYEDGDRLVLLAGVPGEWFTKQVRLENLPTHFGPLTLTLANGKLSVAGAKPPGGFVVRTPTKDVAIAVSQTELAIP